MTAVKREGVKVREELFQGFEIYYVSWTREFAGYKGDVVIRANDETSLRLLIVEHEKEQRSFKPIDVIRLEDLRVGRITSRVADDEKEIYFSFKDDGSAKHTKQRLMDYSWDMKQDSNHKEKFVELTENNKKLLDAIRDLEGKRNALQMMIDEQKKLFESPVTWKRIAQAASEKE